MTDSEIVKSKVDIVDLISSRVDIKKAGKHYKGPCPFHSDNDPSFIVSPELQIYKCFGCGKSGDIFTFLEEYEGMDFIESLEYLAEKANVTLTRNPKSSGNKQKFIEMHSTVNNFYKYILSSHQLGAVAREYLANRGISEKTIKEFEIGYSPQNQEPYRKYVETKKYSTNDLDKAGLAYTYYGNLKDRFSGRITFPLSDHRGAILGFAGRILPVNDTGKVGKYINSPETEIYHKSKMLYGLNLAKDYIRTKNAVILVEGELDMISSFQAGIRNTVAIKGSSLTSEQTYLLKRFADKIIFALDADFAGNQAARRGIEIANDVGLEVCVANLGKYKDPDEAVRGNIGEYKEILSNSKNAWDFLIDSVFENNNPDTGTGKQKISKEVIPILASMKDLIVRSHYVSAVSRRLSIDQNIVYEQLNQSLPDKTETEVADTKNLTKQSRRTMLEERFLALAFQYDNGFIGKGTPELIKERTLKLLVTHFLKFKKGKHAIDLKAFASSLPPELIESFEILMLKSEDLNTDLLKELMLTKKELETLDIKESMKEITRAINTHEREHDQKSVREDQKRLNELTVKLSKLSV